MKYRVTRRGWIVFSALALLLILLGFNLISSLFESDQALNQSDNLNMEASEDLEEAGPADIDEGDSTKDHQEDVERVSDDQDSPSEDQSTDDVVEETTEVVQEETLDYSLYEDTVEIIYFDKNIAILEDDYTELLDEWVSVLDEFALLTLEIEGHINGYPYYDDGPYGLGIAESRAKVVKNYFLNQGIDEKRITIINKGSTDQAVMSDDINEHYLNRRAVIKFKVSTE